MTSGSAWSRCCPVRLVTRDVRARTTDYSLRQCCGSRAPAVRGAICLPNSGFGIVCTSASGAGRTTGFCRGYLRHWPRMWTLKKCFWTAPSCVPTSISLVQPKKDPQAIERSRGGLSTKVHTEVDALDNPLRLILSAGQIADIERATDLIADIRTDAVIADKGYDADALVQRIQASGAQAVIPPRAHRKELRDYRYASVQGPQSDRTILRTYQTFSANSHPIRKACSQLHGLLASGLYLRLAHLNVNSP